MPREGRAALLRPASFATTRRRNPWWFRLGVVVVVGLAALSFVSLAVGHSIAGGLFAIQVAVFLAVFEQVYDRSYGGDRG